MWHCGDVLSLKQWQAGFDKTQQSEKGTGLIDQNQARGFFLTVKEKKFNRWIKQSSFEFHPVFVLFNQS